MYNIKMKTGGNIYPVTEKLIKHNEAEVVELKADGTVKRVIDPTEYAGMTIAEMNAAAKPVAEKSAPKNKSSKKAKKEPETEAPALENIDVSSL